jgi:glycerophosphoryl diester phosphodiesterase
MVPSIVASSSRQCPDNPCGHGARFLKIAHRGYSEKYPENTLLAFAKAVEAGADMIELDVHLCRDGQIVVIHDSHIDRTSNGTGAVADLTLIELKKCNYNNGMSTYGFVEIPTLEEVIDLVGDQVALNIEIKKSRAKHAGIEKSLADLLQKKGYIDRVIVSSFDDDALVEMKRINREMKTGMLYKAVRKKFREDVQALAVYSVHPATDAIDMNQLKWAKASGLMVYPWVAKDRETIEKYRGSGFIDGIMVNDLGLFSISGV